MNQPPNAVQHGQQLLDEASAALSKFKKPTAGAVAEARDKAKAAAKFLDAAHVLMADGIFTVAEDPEEEERQRLEAARGPALPFDGPGWPTKQPLELVPGTPLHPMIGKDPANQQEVMRKLYTRVENIRAKAEHALDRVQEDIGHWEFMFDRNPFVAYDLLHKQLVEAENADDVNLLDFQVPLLDDTQVAELGARYLVQDAIQDKGTHPLEGLEAPAARMVFEERIKVIESTRRARKYKVREVKKLEEAWLQAFDLAPRHVFDALQAQVAAIAAHPKDKNLLAFEPPMITPELMEAEPGEPEASAGPTPEEVAHSTEPHEGVDVCAQCGVVLTDDNSAANAAFCDSCAAE